MLECGYSGHWLLTELVCYECSQQQLRKLSVTSCWREDKLQKGAISDALNDCATPLSWYLTPLSCCRHKLLLLLLLLLLLFFDPGTSFPRYGILSKCEMSGIIILFSGDNAHVLRCVRQRYLRNCAQSRLSKPMWHSPATNEWRRLRMRLDIGQYLR